MSREPPFDVQIKILTIGNSGVGKTSLLIRYSSHSFSPTFITTIGIDFKIKNVNIDGKRVKLQIWDTAGQERFKTITTSYFRGAQGILLVYDTTEAETFEGINQWMQQIKQHGEENVNKLLIANKCDYPEADREVTRAQGEELAKKYGMKFIETSAKTGQGVEEAFQMIAGDVMKRLMQNGQFDDPNTGVKLKDSKKPKKGGCCK
mmetsp:Transcript_37237/g.75992  ORF Transcript_37237/g.75992 Transcript_37237/m.75992 type:complete len:205 (-) Transcript_37237:185-799(-)